MVDLLATMMVQTDKRHTHGHQPWQIAKRTRGEDPNTTKALKSTRQTRTTWQTRPQTFWFAPKVPAKNLSWAHDFTVCKNTDSFLLKPLSFVNNVPKKIPELKFNFFLSMSTT
jgi:hypothetical protein